MSSKSCPYCAEIIQSEAIKCKHCGEWLNKKKRPLFGAIDSIVKSGGEYLEKKKLEKQKRIDDHNRPPNNDSPLSYKSLIAYGSYITIEGKRIDFDEIFGIFFNQSVSTINRMETSSSTIFLIWYSASDKTKINPGGGGDSFLNVIEAESLNPNERHVVNKIYAHISKMSYKYRASRYLRLFQEQGWVDYFGTKIYNEGKIVTEKGKTSNIKTAFENELLEIGSRFSGVRSTSNDPFVIKIYPYKGPKVKVLGFELSSRIEITTHYNHDVITDIVFEIIKKGRVV